MIFVKFPQWHDDKQRSDESFLRLRKLEPVEKRVVPLNMTEAEQLRFLSDYCGGYRYIAATATTLEQYEVSGPWIETTRARTLSDAICLAAAKFEEANS